MKINRIAYSAIFILAIVSLQTICVDTIDEATEIVTQDTKTTEAIKNDAMKIMSNARQDLLAGNMTSAELIEIIKEQSEIIAQAEQKLQAVIYQAVAQAEESENFLDYLISGAQNIGAQLIAPLKSGYGYSEQEKTLAAKMIKELTQQQDEITNDYETALKDQLLTAQERQILKVRYEEIISRLNDEIKQQHIITGEAMSLKRKLFWAAIAAGTVVAGIALLQSNETLMPENMTTSQAPEVLEAVTPPSELSQKEMIAPENVTVLTEQPATTEEITTEFSKTPETKIPTEMPENEILMEAPKRAENAIVTERPEIFGEEQTEEITKKLTQEEPELSTEESGSPTEESENIEIDTETPETETSTIETPIKQSIEETGTSEDQEMFPEGEGLGIETPETSMEDQETVLENL